MIDTYEPQTLITIKFAEPIELPKKKGRPKKKQFEESLHESEMLEVDVDDDMICEDLPLDEFDDLEDDDMDDDLNNLTNQSSDRADKKMTKRQISAMKIEIDEPLL